jgi:hypothetical protein
MVVVFVSLASLLAFWLISRSVVDLFLPSSFAGIRLITPPMSLAQ